MLHRLLRLGPMFRSRRLSPSSDAVPTPPAFWGASGADYRLWRAREAVRQGELLIASQVSMLRAYEARATAITNWISAELLAVVAITTTHLQPRWICAAIIGSLPAFLALFFANAVFRPRRFAVPGCEPAWVLETWDGATELALLEKLAEGFVRDTTESTELLGETFVQLRRAGIAFRVMPATLLLAYGVAWVISP